VDIVKCSVFTTGVCVLPQKMAYGSEPSFPHSHTLQPSMKRIKNLNKISGLRRWYINIITKKFLHPSSTFYLKRLVSEAAFGPLLQVEPTQFGPVHRDVSVPGD
jgi:hypothetical protein